MLHSNLVSLLLQTSLAGTSLSEPRLLTQAVMRLLPSANAVDATVTRTSKATSSARIERLENRGRFMAFILSLPLEK